MPTAKVLVVGPPDGPQGQFVSAISEVKVRSSARTTSGEGTVPMDFGRVRLGIDLDLQLFGFDRDRLGLVIDAVAPGIIGGVVIAGEHDGDDPHFTMAALDDLNGRQIPVVLTVSASSSNSPKLAAMAEHGPTLVPYKALDKETVKSILVQLLETAVLASEGSAA